MTAEDLRTTVAIDFDLPPGESVADALRRLANRIEDEGDDTYAVLDLNGNRIGTASLYEERLP